MFDALDEIFSLTGDEQPRIKNPGNLPDREEQITYLTILRKLT